MAMAIAHTKLFLQLSMPQGEAAKLCLEVLSKFGKHSKTEHCSMISEPCEIAFTGNAQNSQNAPFFDFKIRKISKNQKFFN